MRVAAFLLYLFFHLLGGGNYLHATTHANGIYNSSSLKASNDQQLKSINSGQGNFTIEYADLDFDEEYSSSNDIKQGQGNKLFAAKHDLLDGWYLPVSQRSISNYYYKRFKIFTPFCGNSYPIYITNRVLRI